MARVSYDGVVEAVHYHPTGQIDWVRAYERKGHTFSDIRIIPREQLVERLASGQTFFIGRRIPYLASTFEVGNQIRLAQNQGEKIITTETSSVEVDTLPDAPVV